MATLLEKYLARNVELEKLTSELLSENRILKREKNIFLEQIMILQKENGELKNKISNRTSDDDLTDNYYNDFACVKDANIDTYSEMGKIKNKKQKTTDNNIYTI